MIFVIYFINHTNTIFLAVSAFNSNVYGDRHIQHFVYLFLDT